jgi:superfamily II RNA helicase
VQVAVEMMLGGAFNDVPPEDIAAAMSCLIAEEEDKSAGHVQEFVQRDIMKQVRNVCVCMCMYVLCLCRGM